MHDAAEAYLLDVPRPLKRFMYFSVSTGEGVHSYKRYEARLQKVIFERFGLPGGGTLSDEIKEVDNRILATEYREFIDVTLPPGLKDVEPYEGFNFEEFEPGEAKVAFLDRARELQLG